LRLWGRVVSGMALFIAAIFAAVACFVPEARWESLAASFLLVAIALLGIPALVKVFASLTGDEEILANGVAGFATITSLEKTGWRYNRYYPIVGFSLRVETGGASYPVEIKQAVDPRLLRRLAPGAVVEVRVDRENQKQVVIDWRAPIRTAREAAAGADAFA